MTQALQVAEDHRHAIPLRQPADLLVDHRVQFRTIEGASRLGRRHGGTPLDDSAAGRLGPGLVGDPMGDPVEPLGEQVVVPERPGFPREDHERGLEGIFRQVGVAQDASADAQDHRAVPTDQGLEGRLAPLPTGEEQRHQLPVGPYAHRPELEEVLEAPGHGLRIRGRIGIGIAMLLALGFSAHYCREAGISFQFFSTEGRLLAISVDTVELRACTSAHGILLLTTWPG